jgi:hypothetical protein
LPFTPAWEKLGHETQTTATATTETAAAATAATRRAAPKD